MEQESISKITHNINCIVIHVYINKNINYIMQNQVSPPPIPNT